MADAKDHRDADRALRVERVLALKGERLSISTIVERTGYGRTFVAAIVGEPKAEAA